MNKRFSEISKLDLPGLEQEVLQRWQQDDTYRRSETLRVGAPIFTFYEGPPTANGRPGLHHVLGRTVKDTICRYRTMKGFHVERKGGWDTHGLPVEIEVEKELGLESRAQVEAYGIEAYNRACRDSVLRYKTDWDQISRRIGYWVDLDAPYVTFHTSYIESVWWLIQQIYRKGLLYRGHKIQWYSPGSGTVLSSHEVSLGYQEVQDPSLYVRFRSREDERTSFLAWTTTPWTLTSNVALAVAPSVEYVKVRLTARGPEPEFLILAAARLDVLHEAHEVVGSFSGSDLIGERYLPLYEVDPRCHPNSTWYIVGADFVSTEEGTGVVHIAPAFGADDHAVARKAGFPLVNPMAPDGHFHAETPLVGGLWFKDADKKIARDLRERGLLYRHETYLHNYPHDWRKGTPLMSYPVEGWFIKTTAIKDRLIALNRTITWFPASFRDGRFGDWLENNVDWALSRKRYWGTPLPVWVSDQTDSNHFEVIGSIEELHAKCGDPRLKNPEVDLHRPFVDTLTWAAPDGGTMRRVPDVIDVWFDSGAMPFAQWHYPFENSDRFERAFPADFICEGIDQTRGWFYTLHAIAALIRDDVAFRTVLVNGLILDEAGEKMSKSKGNTVDPFELVDRHGADVLRWYLLSNSQPWDSMKFSERGLLDTWRGVFNTLWNTYSFLASYANIDGFDYSETPVPIAERSELDRWIASRMNSLIREVDEDFAGYHPTNAVRAIERFVDELSNWYIRRSRPRFWKAKKAHAGSLVSDHDKASAYQTTFECLLTTVKLMSPAAPFLSDWLYRALCSATQRESHDSVHLADFPVADAAAIDTALEKRMALARTVVALALLLRNQVRINQRRPLSRLLIVTGAGVEADVLEQVRSIIIDEINVATIEYIDDSSGIVRRTARPAYARLGPRLGRHMKPAANAIRAWTNEEITTFLEHGSAEIAVDGETLTLERADVEILSEPVGEWAVAQDGPVTVALDTHMTDTLRNQGVAREFVNRVQNLRKQSALNLTDRIEVQYSAANGVRDAVTTHQDWIKGETLAVSLNMADPPRGAYVQEFDIDEVPLVIAITPRAQPGAG